MFTDTIPAPDLSSGVRNHTSVPPAKEVKIDGERFIAIENAEVMPTFFMTMVSASDHWLFTCSHGALTAGRVSPDTALFPYYTVDKIMDARRSTGPQTVIQHGEERWEPFLPEDELTFAIERRLLKSINGDSILFEETNLSLQLRFSYRWRTSEKFGFIRTAQLENLADKTQRVAVVDGLENFLPPGMDERTQNVYSCLGDAYKLTEIDAASSLMIHRMASGLTDEAVPMESLLATTVWSRTWAGSRLFGSRQSAMTMLDGKPAQEEPQLRGLRGAYYIAGPLTLNPGQSKAWTQVADIQQTQTEAASLAQRLREEPDELWQDVLRNVQTGEQKLERLIASADGQQATEDAAYCAHHRANVLFNIMRGGVFADNNAVHRKHLIASIRVFKKALTEDEAAWLDSLPETIAYPDLIKRAEAETSDDLLRLCREHLPLVFSRRHGDPSRPWNRFSIRMKDEKGDYLVGFEGNWRDIFQNWEALAFSFPHFNEAFLRKFLNASTADGYNPYRLTSAGMDWEKPDPEDPWATIGYWGDHQIIYVLKFLEFAERMDHDHFIAMLSETDFVFADVPYEIKPFDKLAKDPNHSIHFNRERDEAIERRMTMLGADGKLLRNADGALHTASFLEKLLIPALVKLGNFCPGGGVWMNTQRPEWNDANNALAGWGLSMVTTAYLYRYLGFLEQVLGPVAGAYACSESVGEFLTAQALLFETEPEPIMQSDQCRFSILAALGRLSEHYRERIYALDFGMQSKLSTADILTWVRSARKHLHATLRAARREDGLFHAYNTLRLDVDSQQASVEHLGEMLEGQVAGLSSGVLSAEESITILQALRASRLYCPQRRSYLLYADKEMPSFLALNRVPSEVAEAIPLLAKLIKAGDTSVLQYSPAEGCYRFHHSLANQFELDNALDCFATQSKWRELVDNDRQAVQALYEETFNHQSFTGRSGSMFAFEGLGSIYWHMVSKLMLAVAELAVEAANEGNQSAFNELQKHYFDIQSGLGFRKTPMDYGAFPADAYSHTPAHAGAQQPGLTGMVKEGILARFAELGVEFRNRSIHFAPKLLRREEFYSAPQSIQVIGVDGKKRVLNLPEKSLMFTLAQTPIIYQQTERKTMVIEIVHADGSVAVVQSPRLPRGVATEVIGRTGEIDHIVVRLPA